MSRYIALLRGVNISGKNKIAMAKLKAFLIEYGYTDVVSYLNSGNIIFSCDEQDTIQISSDIRALIHQQFGLDIPVLVILQDKLKELLDKKPEWWGNDHKEWYDNLIFVMLTSSAEEIVEKVGDITEGLEKISVCDGCIFWSFDRKRYAKSNWWKKTASVGIGEYLTIRTANTLKKIVGM